MTALLALEHLNLEDKITVPEDMGPQMEVLCIYSLVKYLLLGNS